jgi:enoyl-CoA hydratase/carnithine racemase
MLKFNVGDRVGTVVIERGSAGMGADFTVGCDRQEPKSGSPFDAFRNISALNKAIAEFPGVLITGVRGRAFGLGVGHFANRAQIALVNSAAS